MTEMPERTPPKEAELAVVSGARPSIWPTIET